MLTLSYNKICSTPPRRVKETSKLGSSDAFDEFGGSESLASGKSQRAMRVNVPLLRARAVSLCMSPKSLRFLAFWTITFPSGLTEDLAFVIFNSALTQMRKNLGLQSYLWAAETQKNGTIHYHLLCNRYMRIQHVNRIFASSINYYAEKGVTSWGKSSVSRYNGVDVKYIFRSNSNATINHKRRVAERVVAYIMKYISKNPAQTVHRRWHCSRCVSDLPVKIEIEEVDMLVLCEDMRKSGMRVRFVKYDHCEVLYGNFFRSDFWAKWLFGAGAPGHRASMAGPTHDDPPRAMPEQLSFSLS